MRDLLSRLPPDRRIEIERVRRVVRRNLPAGYKEALRQGMIVYEVPLTLCPDTYNGQPLWYAALGANKGSCSLHLMSVYADGRLARILQERFRAAGKRLDMGKACLRFRKAEDLELEVIGSIVASTPLKRFIGMVEAARRR